MGVSGVSLCEITDQNREAVVALRIAASQEGMHDLSRRTIAAGDLAYSPCQLASKANAR